MTDATCLDFLLAGQSPPILGVGLIGSGSAQAAQVISNDQLSQRVDTNDEWIRTRTGIGRRRVSTPGQCLVDLAVEAGRSALTMAGRSPEDLDLILLATSTPDDLFGSAPRVQAELGATNAVAFDLTAACSGFLFAVVTAAQYLRTGAMHRALVIGADQLSRFVDWDDRRSCVLFGDGAGAVVLETTNQNGLLGFQLHSDGSRGSVLNLPAVDTSAPLIDGAEHRAGGYRPIEMNGQEVYKFAVREVPAVLKSLLKRCDVSPDQLNWLLLHQANQRILDAVADRLSLPRTKVLSNLAAYGNTSAATIPLMLDEAVRDGRIRSGDLLASSGFGAGLSWGAALLRWQGPA